MPPVVILTKAPLYLLQQPLSVVGRGLRRVSGVRVLGAKQTPVA